MLIMMMIFFSVIINLSTPSHLKTRLCSMNKLARRVICIRGHSISAGVVTRFTPAEVSVEERRGKNGKQVQRGKQNVQSLSVLFLSLIKLSSAILFELQIS